MNSKLETYLSSHGLAVEGMNSDTITVSIYEGSLIQLVKIVLQAATYSISSPDEDGKGDEDEQEVSTKKKNPPKELKKKDRTVNIKKVQKIKISSSSSEEEDESSSDKDKKKKITPPNKVRLPSSSSSSDEENKTPIKKEKKIITPKKKIQKIESSSDEEEISLQKKENNKKVLTPTQINSEQLERRISFYRDRSEFAIIARDTIRKRIDPYPDITTDLITDLFHRYDDLFLQGYIKSQMKEKKLTLEIITSNSLTSTAGSVSMRPGKIIFKISVPVLSGVTSKNKDNMIANTDKVVIDKLDALMQIIEHELVHVITFLYPPAGELNVEGKYDIAEHHGTWFIKTAKTLFGHTRVTHILTTSSIKHKINVTHTKADFKLSQQVYFMSKDGTKHKGKIIKINPAKAVVMTDGGLQYRVPYVILHPS